MPKTTITTPQAAAKPFSVLAGPLQKLYTRKDYKVQFTNAFKHEHLGYRLWTLTAAYGSGFLALCFAIVLFHPSHWLVFLEPEAPTLIFSWVMLGLLVLLQVFTLLGTVSAVHATLHAKDPIPVRPKSRMKVAFVTTRAPGEPEDMVITTLTAMRKVQYKGGKVDVWLLDETRDPILQDACKDLGVKYFSRNGIEKWNTGKNKPVIVRWSALFVKVLLSHESERINKYATKHTGAFAAKSKHGNFNAWMDSLQKGNVHYDILAGVDTDHVPQTNYLERLLGYFRDEDVAYVVGPQVYGNYAPGLSGLVARWSESQASFFQSTIQRSANAASAAMFVGTNYAVRMPVLDQIGGFQACITEDMATGLKVHSTKNPATGKKWKSVYTPDVLAVGEGPSYWAPYFSQQWRWAAGAFDTLKRIVWKVFFKLPLKAKLHYFLILAYYPVTAISWLLAVVSSVLYLVTGATAIMAPWNLFVSLYLMSLVMQMSLYFWNRTLNVSPHEPHGSLGLAGIAISTLAAPIYLSAFVGILLGKKPNFTVTTKGDSKNPDGFSTFKVHLGWAFVIIAAVAYGIYQGHAHPAMLIWTAMLLVICFAPVVLGMSTAIAGRFRKTIPSFNTLKTAEEVNNA